MPINILMPALSPTMTEGNLAKWLKAEGEAVKPGDAIAEIETDKATMEVEAVDEGKLGKILVPAGSQGVKVNEVIGVLLEEGEDASALGRIASAPVPKAAPAAPAPPPPAASSPAVAPASSAPGGRVKASPLARRLATQSGLDLARIAGSGPNGRVVKADIEAAQKAPAGAPRPSAPGPAAAPAFGLPPFVEQPHSNVRKITARRLAEAKREQPHFYLTVECRIDRLLALRKEINDSADKKLSVNDFVIRAAALALIEVPAANASWTETATRLYRSADISVAVAIPGGLITPIIRNAEAKNLAAISAEMKDLAARAREGKLRPEEFQGGTFSVSNLGMYGIREFTAIINPPQGAILALGAGEQRAVVEKGALAVATLMTCTLSVDHRVIDGVIASEFLAAFKRLIESPLRLLL